MLNVKKNGSVLQNLIFKKEIIMKFSKWFLLSVIGMFIIMGCSLDETSPNILPSISSVIVLPDSIGTSDTVEISAIITDVDGTIEDVVLQYGESITDSMKSMISGNDNLYSVEIGPFANNITINYEIKATDDNGEISNYSSSFTIGEVQPQVPNLFINEFMSHNDAAYAGEFDDYPDWIELYNAGNVAIDIGGWSLTDDLTDLTQSVIPTTNPEATTVPPGGYLVLDCDDQVNPGILHLAFKLGDDDDFALVDPDGVIVDQHNTTVIPDDMSEGRVPDGSDNWEILDPSTPGGPN